MSHMSVHNTHSLQRMRVRGRGDNTQYYTVSNNAHVRDHVTCNAHVRDHVTCNVHVIIIQEYIYNTFKKNNNNNELKIYNNNN